MHLFVCFWTLGVAWGRGYFQEGRKEGNTLYNVIASAIPVQGSKVKFSGELCDLSMPEMVFVEHIKMVECIVQVVRTWTDKEVVTNLV